MDLVSFARMSNVLEQTKQQQVLALGRLGWPASRIAAAVHVDRATVTGYLRAAGLAVRGRGRPSEGTANAAITPEVSTDPGQIPQFRRGWCPPTRHRPARPARAHASRIASGSRRPSRAGRNAMAIWQDLVDDIGFTARYASVRRFVRQLRRTAPPDARVVIATTPGEEAQVDYGEGPMVRHPETGKYRRTRLFVLTLAHSRKAVRLLTWQSSAQTWAELHERAFRRLGGTPRTVVLDNLKEGVLTPDVYEPTLNPLYRDVLTHYGVVGLPCRVGDPDRKGKVESGHRPHAEDAAARATLRDAWSRRRRISIAGRRTGRTRASTARPNVRSPPCLPRSGPPCSRSPSSPFGITASACAPCISMAVSKSRPRTTRRRPAGSASASRCSGPISTCGCSIPRPASCCASMSARRAAITASPSRIGRRARRRARSRSWPGRGMPARTSTRSAPTSTSTTAPAGCVASSASSRSRRSTGPAATDDAAKAALELQVPTYRFLRRYLERRPAAPLTLRQIDPLIRQLTLYRDLIDQQTGDRS